VHAGRIAQELNVSHIIAPALSGVFSAFGCLATDIRYDRVMTVFRKVDDMTLQAVEDLFAQVEADVLEELQDQGIARGSVGLQRSMDLRYVGQNYELELPLGHTCNRSDPKRIREGFDRLHERMYKYVTKQPVECVNVRLSAQVPGQATWPLLPEGQTGQALRGMRTAHFRETGTVSLSVFDRDRLAAEEVVQGPAAIEDAWSTTLVYPGQTLRVDKYGNLHISNS
jgi:N-methylhydantoinase A